MADANPWIRVFELLQKQGQAIRELKLRLDGLDQEDELDALEPTSRIGPNHPLGVGGTGSGALIQYVSIVQSVNSDAREVAVQRAMPTTGTNTFWVADPRFPLLTVKLPATIQDPEDGDTVLVTFTGVVNDVGLYGLFGAGGANITPCLVKSVAGNYYVCRTYLDSTQGDTDIFVAKPFKLQQTPFDAQTVNSLTYAYLSGTVRTVAHVNTPTLVMTQTIVPAYVIDRDIIFVIGAPKVALNTDGNSPIKFLDLNVDSRQWVRMP